MGKGGALSLLPETEPSSICKRTPSFSKSQANRDRVITSDELSKHSTPEDCWIAISGKVYDITNWLKLHPGGEKPISDLGGRDVTDIFNAFHPIHARNYLPKYFVGYMEDKATPIEILEHRKLEKMFQENGMYVTNYWFYYRLAMGVFVLLCCSIYGVVFCKSKIVHMLSGVLLGFVFNQFSFIGHDAGHNGITKNRKINHIIGLIVGNSLTGISIGWWKSTHNVHHVFPNSLDYDPDIQHVPLLAVSEGYFGNLYSHFHKRIIEFDWVARFLVAYQHYYYFPLMAVARVNLYAQSLIFVISDKKCKGRFIEIASLAFYACWFATLVSTLPTLGERIAFVLVCHAAAGVLHVQICVSHFPMQFLIGKPENNKWSKTQLVSTMDVDCHPWLDWFHGGLQFQIEHHLFPRLPRHNLRKCMPFVKQFCKNHDIPYISVSFPEANRLIIMGLYAVAKKAKNLSKPELMQSCDMLWDACNALG